MRSRAFLGIDVSKGYADFLLLDENKGVLEPTFQLTDDAQGRRQLKEILEGWFTRGFTAIYCGVESTGGYENNWYNFLQGLSLALAVKVARLNARGVKAVSDAALRRTITDAVSAENIAVYLIGFSDKVVYSRPTEQESVFREGRQHYTYIRMLIKQKVQLSNQLEKLLYQYLPELLVYCRQGIPGWLLKLLSRYSSAAAMRKAGEEKLVGIKGISAAKAKALLAKVGKSEQAVSSHIQHVIARSAKELLHKEEMIGEEKAYVTELHQDHAVVRLLITLPGIGLETAVLLMLEIEDIGRFASAGKLAAYFGVHPTFKQSGDGVWKVGMSKKGRAEVRAALYMASLTAIRWNPILKDMYARFRAKGKNHHQASGVLMHKLLRMIYGVLKSKTGYRESVDRNNTAQAEERQKQNQDKKELTKKLKHQSKYRFQQPSPEAPLSRRRAQTIKQAASQTS